MNILISSRPKLHVELHVIFSISAIILLKIRYSLLYLWFLLCWKRKSMQSSWVVLFILLQMVWFLQPYFRNRFLYVQSWHTGPVPVVMWWFCLPDQSVRFSAKMEALKCAALICPSEYFVIDTCYTKQSSLLNWKFSSYVFSSSWPPPHLTSFYSFIHPPTYICFMSNLLSPLLPIHQLQDLSVRRFFSFSFPLKCLRKVTRLTVDLSFPPSSNHY